MAWSQRDCFLLALAWLAHGRNSSASGLRSLNEEARLHSALFGKAAGYNPNIRPVWDSTKPVQCNFGIAVNNVLAVNMVDGVATLAIWLRASWYDPALDWNSTEYGGLKQTVANVDALWTPDWIAYNHVEEFESNIRHALSKVYLYSDGGGVYWSRPGVVKVTFAVDSTHFPYDVQEIPLEIGAWSYSGLLQNNSVMPFTIMDSTAESGKRRVTDGSLDLTILTKSAEFDIQTKPAERYEKYYACCPGEPWPIIRFVLVASRHAEFYVQNIIMPNLITTVVSFTTFFLPHESGERIGLGITCMLVICAMMVVSKDIIPVTSDQTVMSTFFSGCFCFTLVALSITVLSSSMAWQRADQDDDGERGTRFCHKVCGFSAHAAIILSNRLDRVCAGLCPVSFSCFAVVVLNPTWTTIDYVGGIAVVVLASVALMFVCFVFAFAIRRAFGLDTSNMRGKVARWMGRPSGKESNPACPGAKDGAKGALEQLEANCEAVGRTEAYVTAVKLLHLLRPEVAEHAGEFELVGQESCGINSLSFNSLSSAQNPVLLGHEKEHQKDITCSTV